MFALLRILAPYAAWFFAILVYVGMFISIYSIGKRGDVGFAVVFGLFLHSPILIFGWSYLHEKKRERIEDVTHPGKGDK